MKVNINVKKIKRYWYNLTKIFIKNTRRYCRLSSILHNNYLTNNYSQNNEASPDIAISTLEAEIKVYCYLRAHDFLYNRKKEIVYDDVESKPNTVAINVKSKELSWLK